MFSYQMITDKEKALVICKGDIDIDASEIIEEDIQPAVSGHESVIFDFEKIYFVDSSGIGLMIKLVNDLQKEGRKVRIERIRPEVMEVFELLQMDEILGKETFE
ncbi:STAS domain-containing protein [Paenibacillus sp. URB8-2]|uniref:STAS domain-containing protein n=1 Tax=Paenibacillus sp. URB8-2 TaxID=2741301 RepID=UPI0015BBD8E4|nr:STAS domain-containing protein [Paenibacillus sp. URB8-2]BCG58192.1 anti-sigma F factor antagonist [Paenibacillus sp. URB8-2]